MLTGLRGHEIWNMAEEEEKNKPNFEWVSTVFMKLSR